MAVAMAVAIRVGVMGTLMSGVPRTGVVRAARAASGASGAVKIGRVGTRADRMHRVNMASQSKLYHIDDEFRLFRGVTRVLDLGYSPGNWSNFAKFRLCEEHGVEEAKIHHKCLLLGVDLLVGTPPQGISTVQGNIFSKTTQKNVANCFKEYALRQQIKNLDDDKLYFVKEQNDFLIDREIEELEKQFEDLSLKVDYKPQLILSDLSSPFIQEKGFYHNTHTKPHVRFATNPGLYQPITNKTKSSIDMADASLITACDLLAVGGNMVVRLAVVQKDDDELQLLKVRLQRAFDRVEWRHTAAADDLIAVCLGRNEAPKEEVFSEKI